jgi:hypothetical protein
VRRDDGLALFGFPHDWLEQALATLLGAGYRVALCEEVSTQQLLPPPLSPV